ncbi:MAG: aminotransferase class IV [Phenylobacterium sp.]|jgi:branched-subunit amino acid aminotransferase/4-amino-4-deoxychorismate lyase
MIIWRDGEWLEDGDVLPADDRGLTLGDGVFETLLAMDGALAHAALHFHRLASSAAALGLPPPPEPQRLEAAARETLSRNGLDRGRAAVRLTLTAGRSARGLTRDPSAAARLLISAGPAPEAGTPVRLATVSVRRNPASPASRHKTLSYIDSIMAVREATSLGAEEAVLLNVRGRLACAAAANLVFRIRGNLVTPSLSEGVLPGVTRARLKQALPEMEERPLTRREAEAADGLVLTNALRGLRPAVSWDGRDLPGSDALKSRLEEALSLAEDRASVV